MKIPYLLPLTILLIGLMACRSTQRSATAETQKPSPNQRWMKFVNSDNGEDIYLENAIKIEADGKLIEGREAILKLYKQANWQIKSISTEKIIDTHRGSNYQYEIGKFTTTDGQDFQHLLIWNLNNKPAQRELELIAPVGMIRSSMLLEIDQRRKEWIKLCNEHNAANLVEQLYSEEALYYNHKPVVKGREAITKDYSYMNRPEYNLLLTPILVRPVNETLVFEIGQCSGSYGGKYMLVWQKAKDGKWYVSMDSNV